MGASAAGNIHGGNDKRRHGGAINTSSFGEFDWHSGTSSDNSSYSSDSDEEEQHSIRGKARGERDRDVGGRGKEVIGFISGCYATEAFSSFFGGCRARDFTYQP